MSLEWLRDALLPTGPDPDFHRDDDIIPVQTTTLTLIRNNQSSYGVVTATVATALVFPVVAACTTISGMRSIVYTYALGGETTAVTTICPSNLPQQYLVTMVTNSTVSASNQTCVQQNDTC